MFLRVIKIGCVTVNILLLFVAGIRIALPLYLLYGNVIVKHLNYDKFTELTSMWMLFLVPWDIILAVSGIRSVMKNDREQMFENAFKLSVFGLVIIWFEDGLGDRFQTAAPYVFKQRMRQYHVDPRAKFIIDTIQTKFRCCGLNNVVTWNAYEPTPTSCCVNNTCIFGGVYAIGCAAPLAEYLETFNLWLIVVNFPFVELLVSIWNCLLTDYLPPPEIVYEFENGGEPTDADVRRQNIPARLNSVVKQTVLEVSPIPTVVDANTSSTNAPSDEHVLLIEFSNATATPEYDVPSLKLDNDNVVCASTSTSAFVEERVFYS